MNVLVLTPLYKIEGRPTLQRNTEAIHYLIKYWPRISDTRVYVINTYLNPGRNICQLLKKEELKNYKTDYRYEVDGIPVYLTEIQQVIGQKHFNRYQNRKIIKAIGNVIETEGFKPDLIVAHFPTRYQGVMDEICPEVPKVAVLHSTDTRLCGVWKPNIELISRQYRKVFCRSKAILEQASNMGIDNLADAIIRSGVPVMESPSRKWGDIRHIKFLYVGKLIKRKHPDIVLDVLDSMKDSLDFSFTIVGNGPMEKVLVEKVRKCGLSSCVRFIGQMPREQIFSLMSESDVFVMPSEQETFGLVYLEAMMQGCITIGSLREGIDGIIEDGKNGFLVRAGIAEDLKRVFSTITKMSGKELMRLSDEAVLTAHRYNEETMSKQYLDLITEQYDLAVRGE